MDFSLTTLSLLCVLRASAVELFKLRAKVLRLAQDDTLLFKKRLFLLCVLCCSVANFLSAGGFVGLDLRGQVEQVAQLVQALE